MPDRDESVSVYKFIKQLGSLSADVDVVWWLLGGKINRARLSAILEAFCQNGFINYKNGQIVFEVSAQKRDLFDCPILKHISGYLQG